MEDLKPLEIVLETMQSWIDGERVWPYAKIIETWGSDFIMYRLRWQMEFYDDVKKFEKTGKLDLTLKEDHAVYFARMTQHMVTRDIWVARYGFAIPCAELLEELQLREPIVEIGAGTGYMTKLMRNHGGIDVIGSDPHNGGHGFVPGSLDQKQMKLDGKNMVRRYPERTVFCSWPTYSATWFRQALKAMKVGQKIVVIREDACAEETAWQYLDEQFDHIATVSIPCFNHMNDHAATYVKRR